MDGRTELLLLGAPALRCGRSTDVVPLPEKAFVLAAILMLSFGGRAPRSKLAAILYDEADQAGAAANLRQLLARIQTRQQDFGVTLFRATRSEIRLDLGSSDVVCDLAAFAASGMPETGDDVRALGALYRGDLLEGLDGRGESLGGWIRAQRAGLRDRFCDLIVAGVSRVRPVDGEAALRRAIEVDPYREDAWRALMGLKARRHGLAAAEAVFDQMSRRFGEDLRTGVDGRTAEFLENLRRGFAVAVPARADLPAVPAAAADPASRIADVVVVAPKLCLLMPRCVGVDDAHVQLSQALVEDVTMGLSRLRTLAVIAPFTTWQIASEAPLEGLFDVRYAAETSVRSFAGKVRLTVRLIRMADRVILWSEEYDLVDGAPGEHYVRLSRSIVVALAEGVERWELSRFETMRPTDAYQLYLVGRQHLRVLSLPAVRRARKAFSQAAERAPGFVPALNGMARTLILEWLLLARTDLDILRQAQEIASRAVEADPFSGEARRELASATLFLGGLDDAAVGFALAEQLAPHHADILADHANALTHCSEMAPALRRIRQAIELNPLPPDDYLWTAGGALFFLEDYEGALEHLARMKQQGPAHRLTAACLAMTGRRDEASVFAAKALADQPNFRIGEWMATIPLRSNQHVAHYAGALSEAGFSR